MDDDDVNAKDWTMSAFMMPSEMKIKKKESKESENVSGIESDQIWWFAMCSSNTWS